MGRSTLVMFMLLGLVMMGLVAMTGAAVAGDLEVLDIGFRPVEGLYAGQSLRIYTNVTNNGTEVNSSQVDFYMEEEIIGQMNAQNMMPGETRNLYLDYKTNKADSGSHTFKVKLTEEDENNQNNEKQDNYYINPATPDLVPSDITFDRDLIVDTYVTMTVTVENSGTDLATQVDVKVLQDTTTLTRVNVGNIAEGTSKDVELSFVLESVGTFEFRVQVDYEDRIDEINETNNEISVEEEVAAPGTDDHPDFEPTVLEWPASYVRGQEVDMEVRVWNNGTRGWSNRSVVVALMVNGTIVSETNASMPANYYDEVVLSWRIMEEEGNHTLSVVVDPDDEVEEADEGNNDVQTDIEIRPPLPDDHPDLAISADDIDFSVGGEYINESGAAIDGNDVMIMITVRNLGNMTAMDVPLDIFIDDKWYLNRTIDVNGLWDPPAQKTVVVHWTAIQGNHTIGVWLDQNRSGAVNETDGKGNMRRENNYAERALRVVEGPLPDFAIDSSQMTLEVEGAPVEQVEENTTVNLTVDVWNHGEVSGTTSIHIFDSDVPAPQNISGPLLAKYVREINAGDKVVVGIDWTINRTGVHYIRAIALNGTGGDMDFSNNEGQVSVTVVGEPLPDLMVTDLWLNESAPLRNESVLIRFDVKNNGTADATDHFQVLFTIVGEREDIIGTMWQNSTIFPNETRTLSYVWDINFFVPGVYTLKVQLDPRSGGGHGNVREFDEGNNEATVNITIRALHAPDVGIRPDAIRISPAWDPMGGKWMNNTPAVQRPDLAIISGRSLTLRVQVFNEGNSPMDKLQVNYTLKSLEGTVVTLTGHTVINSSKPLPVGGSNVVEFVIDDIPAMGSITLWSLKVSVMTTAGSSVEEKKSNLPNNYFSTNIWMIPNHADPAVLSLTVDPLKPTVDQVVNLTVKVANLGPTSFTEDLKMLVDGSAVAINPNQSAENRKVIPVTLAPGERMNLTLTHAFDSEKVYTVRVRLEVTTPQLNTTNDYVETDIYVSPIPGAEFVILGVDIPEEAYVGEETLITITIRNEGSEGAEDVSVNVSYDNIKIVERAETFPPGETRTIEVMWIPRTVGHFSIIVTVNGDRAIEEQNYDNNVYYTDPDRGLYPELNVREREDVGGGGEEVPVFIIAGVVAASVAAGIGIFFLLRR